MQLVQFEDEKGFKNQAFVTDNMKDHEAHKGIPYNPPDVTQLDCHELLRDLNNLLIDRGLVEMQHVRELGLLRNTILLVFEKKILDLYKEKENGRKIED